MSKSKKPERAKLAPLKIKLPAAKPRKDEMPSIDVEGIYVTTYNAASARMKSAEEDMVELKPFLTSVPMGELFRLNCAYPSEPYASIKITDEQSSVVRMTLPNKYGTIDPAFVEQFFTTLRKKDGTPPNINDYIVRTTQAKFDSRCFMTPTGEFNLAAYEAIQKAMQQVADELKIQNPLTCTEVVVPKPSFHAQRWHDFPEDTQRMISQVLGNGPSLYPQAPVEKEATA